MQVPPESAPSESASPVIVIPSRMESQRLPGKPLADIAGMPLIARVLHCALSAGVGPVIVACAEEVIAKVVEAEGGTAIMTDPRLPSGSDRVLVALETADPHKTHDIVINLQGDVPLLPPPYLRDVLLPLREPTVDIATLVNPSYDAKRDDDPNTVKAVLEFAPGERTGRVLYFTRKRVPSSNGPVFHHIGIYAYRRAALERFAGLPPSFLEQRESLEQLRALENGMRMDVALVDAPTPSVDTPQDLEMVRQLCLQAPPPPSGPRLGDRKMGDRTLEKNTLGDRKTEQENRGEQAALGKRTLGKRTLGKRTLGKRTLGKRTLGKRTLGKRTLGKRILG